jgi:hypothetical protein
MNQNNTSSKGESREGDNKLIAEFMGESYTKRQIPAWAFRLYDFDTLPYAGYEYHTSWDWIMPVVEKIENEGFDSRIHGYNSDGGFLCDFVDFENNEASCSTSYESKIEAVYKAVVQFITWYNSQTSKPINNE